MRRFLCFTFTLIAFAFLTPGGVDIHALEAADTPAFSEAVPRASTPLGIILFSWDGLDRKVLKELLAARRLPFLAAVPIRTSMSVDMPPQPSPAMPRCSLVWLPM
jgi:hypothetical protein